MHTLAIGFDLAPSESLHPTVGLGVGWETGRGVGQGADGVPKPFYIGAVHCTTIIC